MNRLTKSILYVFGFMLSFSQLQAQNLPEYHFKMLVNDTLNFELFSYLPAYEVTPFALHGDLWYPSQGNDFENIFPISYLPEEDFMGTDHFIFQYRGDPGNGNFTWAVKYSKFTVEVLPSIVEVEPDHVVTNNGDGQIEIDVLDNDSSTYGDLAITELTNVFGGAATVSADNTILFDVDPGFSGVAYLNYLAEDGLGSTGLGQLSIWVEDSSTPSETIEVSLAILNTKALTILLPGNDFELDTNNSPEHGTIDLDADNQLFYYPELDFAGRDTFLLTNADQDRLYFIDIYDIPNDGHAVVDDEVYTLENEVAIFNVLENDHQDYYMDEWTQPNHGYVNYLGAGEFSYSPDEDYHGYDEFTYTMRVAPIVFQTATVRIGVDNFKPLNVEEFKINLAKNNPYLIDYNVPVVDFTFEVVNGPDDGTVTIYPGLQTVLIGCDSITGNNLVLYQPDADFTGIDEFELDYCPGDGDCKLVKIKVEVFDVDMDPDCPCVGRDCVWKGDTNGDGIVTVADLLPIGLFMGKEGSTQEFAPSEWVGLPVEDWNLNMGTNGLNIKHADSDGDGLISAFDTLAIGENYDNLHTIVSNGVNAVKPFPLYIQTSQDSVNAGDWLYLTIAIGNGLNPILDFSGVTYNLQFPPDLIDSSSLMHEFFAESWFTNASSTLQMDKQPVEGRIDAGLTRIGGIGASGFGPIASCDFIVEDDIDGLKLKSDIIPIKIELSGAKAMDQNGNTFNLPSTSKTIYLDLRKNEKPPLVKELNVFPNPAEDYVNVHLNGDNTIEIINIYTSKGVLIDSYDLNNSSNQIRLETNNYNTGIYFIEVTTPKGKTAQRFEVIK